MTKLTTKQKEALKAVHSDLLTDKVIDEAVTIEDIIDNSPIKIKGTALEKAAISNINQIISKDTK